MSDYPSDETIDAIWPWVLYPEEHEGEHGTDPDICNPATARQVIHEAIAWARANPAHQEPPRRKTRPGEYREGGGNPEWDDEAQPWCGPSAEWSERHDPVINAVRAFMETTESDTGVPFMRMVNAFNDYDARIIAEAEPQEPPTRDLIEAREWARMLLFGYMTKSLRDAFVANVDLPAWMRPYAPAEPTEAPKPTSGDRRRPSWCGHVHPPGEMRCPLPPTNGDKPRGKFTDAQWWESGNKLDDDPRNPSPTPEPTREPDPWALPSPWVWREWGEGAWFIEAQIGKHTCAIWADEIGALAEATISLSECERLQDLVARRDAEDPPK